MIYLSDNLYVSPGSSPDFNANSPVIGYQSVLTIDDISASGISFQDPKNAWSPDTYSTWVGGDIPANQQNTQFLYLHNTDLRPIDYIGLARHNFGEEGYIFSVDESSDQSTWTPVTTDKTTTNESSIIELFEERTTEFFRVKIEMTIDNSAPIVGHVKMGKSLTLQRRIYVNHTPAPLAASVKRQTLNSENGQFLGQIIKSKYHTTECVQENNTPQFVREFIVPFINHANGIVQIPDTAPSTFFFAWRPEDYPEEVVYGWTNDNIQPLNQGNDMLGGRMSFSFKIEAIA